MKLKEKRKRNTIDTKNVLTMMLVEKMNQQIRVTGC